MAIKRLQLRRDIAADWTSNNPTLLAGEMGVETDTGKFKVGDGSTAWNSLAYSSGPTGATGATGTGYSGVTATTSLSIGTGSRTFTGMPTIGAYTVGTRVRVASTASPTNWMEGVITGTLGGTQIGVSMDTSNGSGTFAAWTFSVAGTPGAAGTNGQGVPTAGTTNQVLKKNSGTNYDTVWVDQSTLTAGDTVKVAGVQVYIQTTDPGAVGAGKIWIQTV